MLQLRKSAALLSLLLFLFSQSSKAGAAPADWTENDWAKYIELIITVSLDKLHGGIKQAPVWMLNPNPVNGRLPLLDAYSALSATSSSVKPGLLLWLKGKMEQAALDGDDERLNGYQAFHTALATGDNRRLTALQRKAQQALDRERARQANQSLVLNDLLASVESDRRVVGVVPQFTVGGNEDGLLTSVRADVAVRGPETSLTEARQLTLHQPRGYQASEFFLTLPANSPGGRYTVQVTLSDARGLSSSPREAAFNYRPPEPEEPGPEEPETTEPESDHPDPGKEPGSPEDKPDKEPTEPDTQEVRVQLSAPSSTPVGRPVRLTARVEGGSPPYRYHWKTDGKNWSTEAVALDYDTPGWKSVELVVVDSEGRKGRGASTVIVEDGIAVNITGPRKVRVGESAGYTPVVVTGPDSGFAYTWTLEGRTGQGERFSTVFETVGEKVLICRAKHPEYPVYESRATITVEAEDTTSEPLEVAISGPAKVRAGEKATFLPDVSGGTAPYSFTWVVEGKTISKDQISGKFDNPGSQEVRLQVVDAKGRRKTAALELTVADFEQLRVSIEGPGQARVGEKVSFSPQMEGGAGPFRYLWSVKGKSVEKESIQGKFDKPGPTQITLTVYDQGREGAEPVSVAKTLNVEDDPRPNASASPKEGPVDQSPVTAAEFAGTYRSSTKTSWGGVVMSEDSLLFREDGARYQVRSEGLINRANWRLENGVLTVWKSDSSDYWNYQRSGPITRIRDGYYQWVFRSNKNPGQDITNFLFRSPR